MTQTILILGATGRIGRHAGTAFARAGWSVRGFRRGTDDLLASARGADVILYGWNPPYPDWRAESRARLAEAIAVAETTGAALMFPGNVYVYGNAAPELMTPRTPHAATNPLGRIRVEMEAMLRASSAKTVVLRAGDFLDPEASGNWFDMVMLGKLAKGKFVYPGAWDRAHAFAYLPDLAACFVALAQIRDTLPSHTDLTFEGFTLTGQDLKDAVERALGIPLTRGSVPWFAMALVSPFWAMGRALGEMRYLWDMPHRLDPKPLRDLLGNVPRTPPGAAIADCLRHALPQTGTFAGASVQPVQTG